MASGAEYPLIMSSAPDARRLSLEFDSMHRLSREDYRRLHEMEVEAQAQQAQQAQAQAQVPDKHTRRLQSFGGALMTSGSFTMMAAGSMQ